MGFALADLMLLLGVAIITFVVGKAHGRAESVRAELSVQGFNRRSAELFVRATRIISRLDGLKELDGVFSPDMLSPESEKLVKDWLADYRRELQR